MKTLNQNKPYLKAEEALSISKKLGAESCEIIYKSWTTSPILFENNKLKSLESSESSGISVRLIKGNKIGISSSTDLETIESTVLSAVESSEFGPEATFDFTKQILSGDLEKKTNPPELPLEELVEKGESVIKEICKPHKDILVSGGFELGCGETVYLNSYGVSGKRSKSIFSTNFSVNLIQGEDFLGIYDGESNTNNFPDESKVANKIIEKLSSSMSVVSLSTNKYTVIFTPKAISNIFVDILGVVLNGKAVQQGISTLSEKLGQKLFDEKLTLIEDPNIGTSISPFDDEGIKTNKKALIKNGVINSFYFDLNNANKISKRKGVLQHSTGNGFKSSLAVAPSPQLTSLLIPAGNSSVNDLVASVKEGILIDQVLGAGQSNTLAGEFNIGIDLGFKIKNGKIQGRIKNCMVAGNIFEVLSKINAMSSEHDCINGSEFYPYFLIENLTVAAK